jgi:hypothetical protein
MEYLGRNLKRLANSKRLAVKLHREGTAVDYFG